MTISLNRRLFLTASTALGASLILPRLACAQAPRTGGQLIVAAKTEPFTLNSAMGAANSAFYLASKVIEPLAEASFEGEDGLEPRLATGWEGSEDGLTITFKLREGVTFHDGEPFTSADVAFSALRIWKALHTLGRTLFKDLEAVDTPDKETAVFRFSRPMPLQLIRAALPSLTAVFPKHLYDGVDIPANAATLKLIGTGPFKFAAHEPGKYYRLERNRAYWNAGQPYVDEIIYRLLPDGAAVARALATEEIHLAAFSAVPLADLARISKLPGLQAIITGYEALTAQLIVEINHRRPELADVRVRQAMAHAIDRAAVVKTIFYGLAMPSTGPIPLNSKTFYTKDVTSFPYDLAAAQVLLDEAGYKAGPDGVRFRLKLLPAPHAKETRQFGDYLRQALAAIGIAAEIVDHDAAGHEKAVYTDHAFDLAVAAAVFRGDPAISTTILVESGIAAGVSFSNQGGYANPIVDSLIRQAAVTLDPAERVELYHEFQRVVADDLPLINVAEWSFTTVANSKVRNVGNNPRWALSNWADVWIAA